MGSTSSGLTTRLAQTSKARLTNIQKTPLPPRGPAFTGTNVTWEDPQDTSNVTDYNVYVNTETQLAARVPLGQNTAANISGTRVFISSFNSNSGFESNKVLLNQTIGNLDTAPPPPPSFFVSSEPGFFILLLPAFPTTKNLTTLASGTWTIYCFDESSVALSALNGGCGSGDVTIILDDVTPFSAQQYAIINQEIVFITAVDTGSETITVARSQKGSVADPAGYPDQTLIFPLTVQPITVPIDPTSFGTVQWALWKSKVPMRDFRVVACELYVSNSIGKSAVTTNLLTNNATYGIRVLAGLNVQFSIDGILGIQSDIMAPYFVPQTSSFNQVVSNVRTAPTGAALVAVLNKSSYAAGTPFITTLVEVSTPPERNGYTGYVGMLVTIGIADLTVNYLGRWVCAGNSLVHSLILVRVSDNSILATCDIDTSLYTSEQYAYGAIVPTVLTAGAQYWIMSSEVDGRDALDGEFNTLTTVGTMATIDFSAIGTAGAPFTSNTAGCSFGVNFVTAGTYTKIPLATMTIPAGFTVSNTVSGFNSGPILDTEPLSVDITGCGTTYPGERLVVYLEL